MPTKPATKKPAAKGPAKPATVKPAAAKAKESTSVTMKDLAAKVGRDTKSVRASVRRILGGAQVGKGGRYKWKSWDDKQLKELLVELQKTDAE